ncbi:MAG TPA: thioredoxin family protein [Aggregatilinea sp.]|uniref:thioredoxin family protein n=1 Tax=Aggregatilinea sp. TaxID=2806333 RepID=UPI002B9365AE|nr:thioredoxin family protein [Aggregatilinea sp.]HML24264.1 thioredoxin family protein [Aggregatilinea sp.]
MIERLIVLVLFSAAGLLAYRGVRRWQIARLGTRPTQPLLSALKPGVPAIVYFTSPDCGPCRAYQRPAIERVQHDLGDCVQVIEVDALAEPDAAARWGVMTVPTTFILDRLGHPREVNNGVAGPDKLKQQLQAAASG